MALQARALTDEEQQQLKNRSQSRTAAVRDVERARIILQSSQGQRVPEIARTLDLRGRRFETWAELAAAVWEATTYWNAHRHPIVWGRRRRHRPGRQASIALVPSVV